MISDEFLQILRCPIERTPLTLADQALVERLNEAIAAGRLQNRIGQALTRSLDGGLLNRERSLIYPVYDDIPTLIADEAIALEQLDKQT